MLNKITDKKQNRLGSSCAEDISTNFLPEKMEKISYNN